MTTGTARFDLTLELTETSDGPERIRSSTTVDLFETHDDRPPRAHFLALLEGVADGTRYTIVRAVATARRLSVISCRWNGTGRTERLSARDVDA